MTATVDGRELLRAGLLEGVSIMLAGARDRRAGARARPSTTCAGSVRASPTAGRQGRAGRREGALAACSGQAPWTC